MLLLLILGVLGIHPRLQARNECAELLLLCLARAAVHRRNRSPLFFGLAQRGDDAAPVRTLPRGCGLKSLQVGDEPFAPFEVFLQHAGLGGEVFLTGQVGLLCGVVEALPIGLIALTRARATAQAAPLLLQALDAVCQVQGLVVRAHQPLHLLNQLGALGRD